MKKQQIWTKKFDNQKLLWWFTSFLTFYPCHLFWLNCLFRSITSITAYRNLVICILSSISQSLPFISRLQKLYIFVFILYRKQLLSFGSSSVNLYYLFISQGTWVTAKMLFMILPALCCGRCRLFMWRLESRWAKFTVQRCYSSATGFWSSYMEYFSSDFTVDTTHVHLHHILILSSPISTVNEKRMGIR